MRRFSARAEGVLRAPMCAQIFERARWFLRAQRGVFARAPRLRARRAIPARSLARELNPTSETYKPPSTKALIARRVPSNSESTGARRRLDTFFRCAARAHERALVCAPRARSSARGARAAV
ncbi:MAG TPA: hypothetical protein VHC22_29245, partial [Pirellulales bacterium]|nr:hypothetical protein [Pirellulales bacterium]